jgi:hypothetical protein
VDADQPRPVGADVSEAVWHVGRSDHDVTWAALDGFLSDVYADVAFENDERLVLGVAVQLRPLSRVVIHEEERDR